MVDYNESIRLNPLYIEAYHNLGCLFSRLGEHHEAIKNFEKILSLDSNSFEAHFNIGDNFKYLRKYSQAISHYEKSIGLNKEFYAAYWNLAPLLLKMHHMKRGWDYYEYRILSSTFKNHFIPNKPCWSEDTDNSNKILLIHPDGGLGDFIQFYRFVSIAVKSFKKVILECPKPLVELIKASNVFDSLVVFDSNTVVSNFDYQCLIMSLPHLTKYYDSLILDSLPYIKPDINYLEKWSNLFSVKKLPRVGICWQGAQRSELDDIPGQNRSIPLNIFKELFDLPIEFHILQLEISKNDMDVLNGYNNIRIYTNQITNFSDTASIIDHLDLVISIDTSLAHLCGAMNKDAWILLPYLSDYRWGDDLQDFSPWYNSLKLFRQEKSLVWTSTIKTAKINLLKHFT